jgi:hypothetical protein
VRNPILVKAVRQLFVCLAVALLALPAMAGPNDIYLLGLVKPDVRGGYTVENGHFRSLVHEMALVMTPPPLQPAETTGQAGFDFGIEYGAHDISEEQPYWQSSLVGTTLENRTAPIALQTLGVRGAACP